MRSLGNTGSRTVTWVVTGSGTARLRVGSCRTGWIEQTIEY
jgi:hypothetical protein